VITGDEALTYTVTNGATAQLFNAQIIAAPGVVGTIVTEVETAVDAIGLAGLTTTAAATTLTFSSATNGVSLSAVVAGGTQAALGGVASNGVDVAKVSTVTLSGTFIAGDTVAISVTDADAGGVAGDLSTYTYTVLAGNTLANVAAGLALAIDGDGDVAAAPVGGVITITDSVADDGGFTLSAVTITNAAQLWADSVRVVNGSINVDTVAGSLTNYAEVDGGAAANEAACLALAQGLLDGTVLYAMVYNAAGSVDGVLYYDADGVNGNETCVTVTGVALAADFAFGSIV
jgi:hypothetical protein